MLTKEQIIEEISSAFNGVTLDDGISLNQTRVIDNYGRGCTDEEFEALPLSEVTDDWTKIPLGQLDEADCLAHFDRKGFRYYVPALLLRLLDNYDPDSMMTIGTLSILYPKTQSWPYLYTLLTENQLKAVAHYLEALPNLVDLWGEDQKVVERAYCNSWSKYLQS